MTALELAANAVYLISVFLANKNSVHTWWTGIAGCLLFAWFFYENQLYADVTLMGFFVVTSALGWWHWLRGSAGHAVPVRTTPPPQLALWAGISVWVAIGYGALLKHFTAAFAPFLDSVAAAASVLAQLLLMGRRVETWWFWLLANTIYVPLYAARGAEATAVVYAAFWINAFFSLSRWRKLVVA